MTGMPSDSELAAAAREALHAILTGQTQSLSEGARSLTHLDPKTLREMIKGFEGDAARAQGRRIFAPISRVQY